MPSVLAINSERAVLPQLVSQMRQAGCNDENFCGLVVSNQQTTTHCTTIDSLLAKMRVVDTSAYQASGAIACFKRNMNASGSQPHIHHSDLFSLTYSGTITNCKDLQSRRSNRQPKSTLAFIASKLANDLVNGISIERAVDRLVVMLNGDFVLLIMKDGGNTIIAAHKNMPIYVTQRQGETQVASNADFLTIEDSTKSTIPEGSHAKLTNSNLIIWQQTDATNLNKPMQNPLSDRSFNAACAATEMNEQPAIIAALQKHYNPSESSTVNLPQMPFDLGKIEHVHIYGSGACYVAGIIGKFLIERMCGLPVTMEMASESRYQNMPVCNESMCLFLSRSGETSDTIAALRQERKKGCRIVSIVGSSASTLAKESDIALPLIAKTEAAGISSRAYLAELIVLTYFAVGLSQARQASGKQNAFPLPPDFIQLPTLISELLARRAEMQDFTKQVRKPTNLLFLGRGPFYAVALEAALKTKKMTGISAEGVAGGEFHYGLLHSIEKNQPLIIIAPSGLLFGKLRETIKEINRRGGKAFVLTDAAGAKKLHGCAQAIFVLPIVSTILAPIFYTVALQLFTLHLNADTHNQKLVALTD